MKNLTTLQLTLSLSIFILFALVSEAKAQTEVKFKEPQKAQADVQALKEKPYKYVNQMPEFEGGEVAFLKFMATNLKYPSKGAEGTTYASFIVEKDGSVSDIKILKSSNAAMDKEAIRVLKLTSGKWKPGKQNGKVVRVQLTQPIEFTATK